MKTIKKSYRWFAILLILPVMLILLNSAITVVPGSAAEYTQHWITFSYPIMFIPALMRVDQLLQKRTLFFGLGLCFLSVWYPLNIDNYEPVKPLRVLHNSKERPQYIDSGKWFPCCIPHDICYVEYMYNGVVYRRKPQDMFRVNTSLIANQIFVNRYKPQIFLAQKKHYVSPVQRVLFVSGISFILLMPIHFLVNKHGQFTPLNP